MKFSIILKGAAAAAAVGGLAVTTAGAASASTTTARQAKPVEAITRIVNRTDGGGGGPWAYDSFTRDLKVFYLGKSADPAEAATPYMYYATITDTGTFRDRPGALTPNQGGHYAGENLRPGQVTGPISGFGQWAVFYASAKAHNGLAPSVLKGQVNSAYPSSTWPELAFPAGTTFAGVSESSYGYDYQAVPFTKYVVRTVNGKHVIVKVTDYRQHWSDTSLNGDGQLPGDGNILGAR